MPHALQATSVSKIYTVGETEVRALDVVDVDIDHGDFVSIMGPSGSGKTTLLNILGCIDRPTSGKVFIGGKDAFSLTERELDRLRLTKIGFVFQRINLIQVLTAAENVVLPLELAGIAPSERRRRAMELLESVGLEKRAGHRPAQLSAGEQQRVGIARALANRPDVLLADEPTGNLDSANSKGIMSLLEHLNRDLGQTLIIVTHDSEVGAIAMKKLVIRDGKIESHSHKSN
ncbi:MAG TPA: ABC transporter ATP-binding protein [bacterium]|nr:ABC transporter ATP-binding protein [bacterium]